MDDRVNTSVGTDSNSTSRKVEQLQSIWARILNLPLVPLDEPFLSVGGDSISAMQVVGQCRKEGIGLKVHDVLQSRSITQLVEAVKEIEEPTWDYVEYFDEPFNLTPIQSLYFKRPNVGCGHFNQSFSLQIKQKVVPEAFQAAMRQLVARHSMLRARFSLSADGDWQQILTEDISGSYRFRYRVVDTQHEMEAMITESQHCLDYKNGPLLAADFFDFAGDQVVFLTADHIVIDLVSWRLLLEELEDILRGERLLPVTISFQKWADLQAEQAESLQSQKLFPSVDVPPLDFAYWDIQPEDNTYGNAIHALFELEADVTSLFLGGCHKAYRTESVEILLASLIQSWSHVFVDRPAPALFNEGHGREPWSSDIDISRTVGWFTALTPIVVTPSSDLTETVSRVKDFKRQIPGNGRPYFAKRCLTNEGRELYSTHWPMEVLFNYLGQYQQLERTDALLMPLDTMAGEYRAAGGTSDFGHTTPRWGLFEISAVVFKGRLKFAFTFNRNMRHQDLIQRWVTECRITLTDMVRNLMLLEPIPTLSDFPLLSLTEERFQSMLNSLKGMGIMASDVEEAYPCSSMQEGLLLSQSKDSGFYAAVTLHEVKSRSSKVESDTVADAWRQVVRRHAALRTIFLESSSAQAGLYIQVVLKTVDANIVHFSCEDEAQAIDTIKFQRPVNYHNGKCQNHRLTLCTTSDQRVFCSLDINHAIMDGHSMSLLICELRDACEGQLQGTGPPFSDYISWLGQQSQEASLEFWKSYLKDSEICSFPVLDDGQQAGKKLVSLRVDMNGISMQELRGFCNTNGMTLSNIFHTAWALTLRCYVGNHDVMFGYLTSARDAHEIRRVEDMVGPIINTLVCRVSFGDGSRCLFDILQDVQKDYMEALPHRHISLADIQHAMKLSGASLFNTALSYRRLPPDLPSNSLEVTMAEIAPIYDPTEYPVSMNIEVGDLSLAIDLDYWSHHLSAGQAANVASTFASALENIIHNYKTQISALDHLSREHREQIDAWNIMPATLNDCVHHRFAAWVASQPGAPAIRGFDGDYTYADLDIVTNRLAHHLTMLGIGPEDLVPTCFTKSSFAVVAMLSVLKAGGAAVPLDAAHPIPALQTRIEDTRAKVILTTAARAEDFRGMVPNVVVVDLETLSNSLPNISNPPSTLVSPQNPCFVIFTSGSTGRPKGVVLGHAAMVTSAEAHGSKIGIGPGSRVLQFASYTFDNSLEEIFTTLQRGGCVCVPSEQQRMDNLPGAIAELDANFMDLTPTVAALFRPEDVPSIKTMCLGAEPLTKALVELWRPHIRLYGQYGPSEASINSAWKDFADGGEATNIGRAVGSVSWITDPDNHDRLMPIGCKGELILEGPILSRGYLNDAEKTAALFITDPEWSRTAEQVTRRFYCTGDLVQYTSEGEMIYLGRKDNQIKLNGQRIELGEIEHHLRANLPDHAKSAVELVKFTDSNAQKALVAFLCLEGEILGSSPDTPSALARMTDPLRAIAMEVEVALSNALPAYYVPSYFMPVTSMPMTTSGKLDRRILRQLAATISESKLLDFRLADKSGPAPSRHIEVALAHVWADVLKVKVESIGLEASFFRLGGDSVGAMRLVTASRTLGIIISVANVFAKPRLVDMAAAAVLDPSGVSGVDANVLSVPFELIPQNSKQRIIEFAASECEVFPESIDDIYPCSRLQEGLIALSTRDPGTYVAQPTYRLPLDIDIPRFKDAWNRVIANEAVLRTRIIHNDEFGFLQVVVRSSVEWHTLTSTEDIEETHRQLPASPGGPLVTYTIVDDGSSSPLFIWTAHHAVYDGWSWSRLFNQVQLCYHNPVLHLPTPVPFSRFIKYLSKLDRSESDRFWVSRLEGFTGSQFPQLSSPTHKVQASSQLRRQVKLARRANTEVTIPSFIRAAWGLLLATFSGIDDVIWGETNSGREAPVPDIQDIIGPTLTTAPVRLRIDRDLTVRDYLQETQCQASESLPYQFAGLQHIQKLIAETAVACDFQSFLSIVAGDDLKDAKSDLWNMQSTGTLGTNFFSYALVFNCTVESDSLEIEVLYDAQLTETWYIERLLEQFDYIINCFSSPNFLCQRLGDIELLNPADRKKISGWNNKPARTIHRCIHRTIYEDQVLLRPNAPAIDAWDTGVVSYQDLDERSTRLASLLVSLGIEPQSFVPICFDKSGWTIVAVLAVLKAGAAFVPLDFEAPIIRLREVVSDVKAQYILCAPTHEEMCQSIGGKTLIVDGTLIDRLRGSADGLPEVQSDRPAYAFYTSGSTGKPKAVVINHSSWVSSSTAFAPTWGLSELSRVLQFASYVFDACLIEIFSTLMRGGTVCVPDQASRTNDLAGVINKYNVNWATLTPSVVRTIQPLEVPGLRTLVLIGEAMSQQDLLTWVGHVTLGNGYGPTECSAISTSNIMTPETKPNNLGKVVTARGWVVSKTNHHVLTPVGAVGELLLEGPAVGSGYLNNPEKTVQAFIKDPKWSTGSIQPGSTLFYKTGDLVRYNSDGTLLWLGRKDAQTKVRGQRLELSEVEHHLMADHLVQNALAFVPTVGPCAKRLIGIISLFGASISAVSMTEFQMLPRETSSLQIGAIRDHLYEKLPAYMIPSLWIAISRFPLTPGGKMDRRRMERWLDCMDMDTYRAISNSGLKDDEDGANVTESKLRTIFANTLNFSPEDIRLNQSFLHLGGDSIAAMQVSSQCRAQGMAISVQELIRAKSITALAAIIHSSSGESATPTSVLEYNLPFELSPIQNVFFDTVGDHYNHFNQTELFCLARNFTLDEVTSALKSLVTIHPMLRARFSKDEAGVWQQRIEKNSGATFRIRQHHVSRSTDDKLRTFIDSSQITLNILDGPVFSVNLFEIDETSSQAISMVAHHLVVDVVSWDILLDDFQGLLNGVKPQPQSLPFHSWVQQQAAQAKKDMATVVFPTGEIAQTDLDYWGMKDVRNVHADVVEQDVALSTRDTMMLLGAQDALGTDTLDILIAALFESFRRTFPDRPTITIHNEGHGREPFDSQQDLTRTIGWFSTLAPIHLPVPSDDATTLVSTIRWVKEVRERMPGKGRPYFAHHHLTQEGRTSFAGHWPAEAILNYHGRIRRLERKDSLLQQLVTVDTSEVGDEVPRLALFDITAAISGGVLKMSFGFNRHMKRQAEIQTWIAWCRQTLVDAVDELLRVSPRPSVSDFKLLPLTYDGTARLHSMLPVGTTIADVEDIYPASPMQQGLLISQMKNHELYTYHAILEVQSTAGSQQVDPGRLTEAWQVVIHRHPILRTIFIDSLAGNGSRDQVVLKTKPGRVQVMTHFDDNDVAGRLREQPPIDCRDLIPPHRMTICKTKKEKVWIKLELSHTINDGTSIVNILTDISRAYEGKLTRADTGPLYHDYIAYILASSQVTAAAYWSTYLSGMEPCLFPSLNDGKTSAREHDSVEVTVLDSESARNYCKTNGVTLSNVLQLAWALVLHCYVGTYDVSFGVVASGRDVPVRNIEEAVGCFVNMLITRLAFSDETTMNQLLEKLQADSTNALAHQGCSLADVQHRLQLPVLFNTAFTLQRRELLRNPEETALIYGNMEADDSGEYAITINADVTDESITVNFGFWKDKVCVPQAQNMADTFQNILNEIISSNSKDLTVGMLDVSTSGSLRQILQWNKTLPISIERCVHEMIREQALLQPRTSRAVEGHDGSFTYREFDNITDQIAVYLQSVGVTTETLVPILFERSSWAILSMIAIMKAGGAYVPLDPKHPDSRLRELITDVSAKVVLCSRTYHARVGKIVDTPVIIDAKAFRKIRTRSALKPYSDVTPANAAYCVFTSGTTGKPKGTVVPHQAFCTSATAFTRRMNINATSRTFQFASYTFDASCIEILSALMVGATVCVPSEEERMNNPAGAIRKYKANWSLLTPSVLGTIEPGHVPCLKTLVSGGEALPGSIIKKWGTNTCLINAYGPTECAVVAATCYKSSLSGEILETEPGTIGTGSGCRLWVVHPLNHDKLMPVGSIGELLIEGSTVARGYLNDEVKTAKAFIANPAWASTLDSTGAWTLARMYKSGDLVRYNSDGSISYIGRKDTQIKLNGQRIELGEIEFHVGQNLPDGIQSAVELVAPSNRTSTKALAVFFSVGDKLSTESTALAECTLDKGATTDNILLPMDNHKRDMCKSAENGLVNSLPSYMIPIIFIPIKKMPWTAAGKLDRYCLRNLVQDLGQESMAQYRLTSSMNKKQASTNIEKKVVKIVCLVLNLPESAVGVDDNFIMLGGDSVSAMRLVAATQTERLELSVADIFKNPRLSDIATKCRLIDKHSLIEKDVQPFKLLQQYTPATQVLDEVSQQCRVPKTQIKDIYPTSALQEALFTLSVKQAGAYVAQHVLELTPPIAIERLKAAWEDAVRDIDILRTRIIQLSTGSFLQAVLADDPIIWHNATSLEEVEADTIRVSGRIGQPLTAYTHVRTTSGKEYLVWTIHHSVYDGWSLALVLQRVQQIYQKGCSDLSQTPYTRFIKYLLDTNVKTTRDYWKANLAGVSINHFPKQSRYALEEVPNGDTIAHSVELPSQRHNDITQANTARAAWAMLLSAYTGSDDVVFGETLTGRDISVAGIADIYGPTLTTVPTRIQINRDATVSDFLRRISTDVTDRIPHQHCGLSDIKRIDDNSAAACDFQNLLVIQTANEETPDSIWSVYDKGAQSNFFTYPLVIECTMRQANIEVLAHYHTNIMSTVEVQRLLYVFGSILTQLNSVTHVKDVKAFSAHDMSLLRKWNAAEPVAVDDTIPALFLKMAASQPDAIAISAWDGELTYSGLRDLSCRFAQRLVKLGVSQENLIPACLDKSRWAIVAILGILIAGAGYVPLSCDSPPLRHQQILAECKSTLLVCSSHYESRFSKLVSKIVCINEASIGQMRPPKVEVPLQIKGNNICYVIFTSGSTGLPKGVVVEHRAIASSSAAICSALHISPSSRVFQFCSFAFDVSIGETLAVLIRGATICMPSEEQRTADVASAISSLKADWAFLTPTVADLIDHASTVSTLKTLVTGGEVMTQEVVDKFASALQLCNGYGPTEGTIFAITNDQVSIQRDPTNIGRATESGRAWLTIPSNPHRLAPIGAVAELCIEGHFLARCYMNDPEKTAESFVENPDFLRDDFNAPRSRIYRTGDRVKYAPDGSIKYLGRGDDQIKVAGQRVEPGEIEHHLKIDNTVQSAVVHMPKSGPGKGKLLAVVSFTQLTKHATSAGQRWDTPLLGSDVASQLDRVKRKLSDQLPSYMVPSVWVAVPCIPLLASAKVDRKLVETWLERMDGGTYQDIAVVESSEGSIVPATKTAAILQRIWANVLGVGVNDVKINRPWLSLGGDSITAMRLLAKCRAEGIHLTLNQVLRARSLVHLANDTEPYRDLDPGSEETGKYFDLSPVQRLYFGVKGNEEGSQFNQSCAIRLSHAAPLEILKFAFDSVVGCHSMLRARFCRTDDGQWRQLIPRDDANAYALNVHNIASRTEAGEFVSATQQSLCIRDGPVFAVDIFNLRTGEQLVFMAAHHLVIDFVSWQIIFEDLENILKHGMTHRLPKELPFQIWCERQASQARCITKQEATQKQQFAAQPADLSFWGMDKRPNVYGDVERDEFLLGADISALTLNNHKILKTDVVDLLVAAILHSFSRVFFKRQPPTVFNESHGREPWASSHIDLSRTVGWFTTLFPISVDINEDEDDVVHTVRQVKDLRRRITDNGRPYFAHQFIVEDDKESLAKHTSMEVLFNYLGKTQQHGPTDSFFKSESLGEEEDTEISDVGTQTTRLALFEITASVVDGRIQMSFMYNRWMKNRKDIRRWIAECERTIEDMVSSIKVIRTPQPTMADFPLLPLDSYGRLDRVLKTLPLAGVDSYEQVEDIFPCSATQEGVLLSQIKDPASYWTFTTFEVNSTQGRFNQQRLAEAWAKVVRRHQALRTIIVDSVCKGGVFDQIVLKSSSTGLVSYRCEDSELTATLNSINYHNLNGKLKPRLPHQAALVETSSGRVIVKIIVNHAVIDGASLAIIGHDLQEGYKDRLSSEKGPLYSDYIRYLQSLDANAAIEFWKKTLRGVRPCYFPMVPQRTMQRQLCSTDMEFDRFAEVHAFAENNNVTLANILLFVWALTLHSYTGASEICYGYLTSGRNTPIDGIEDAVGAFINMLVMRVSITPTSSVLDIMRNVQNYCIESVPHQHCSLAQFQHDLELGSEALFNTVVSVQNSGAARSSEHADKNIQFEQLDGHDPSEFAITVNIDTTRADEVVRLTYWTDAVSDNEAKSVSSLMAKILALVLAHADQTIMQLDLTRTEVVPASAASPLSKMLSIPKSPSRDATSRSILSPPVPWTTASQIPTSPPIGTSDWTNLIHSIANEIVPQIVDQVLRKCQPGPDPAGSKIYQTTKLMTEITSRRASMSQRSQAAGSARSRRMSITSKAESKIQTTVDLMAVAGAKANGALYSSGVIEKKLVKLWSELLDIVEETIEKDDSFFYLGGDSIIAMRLVGAAREEGLLMTVADVFKHPTFTDMARVIRVAGEVTDEVMSRAGGESTYAKNIVGHSRSNELASSIRTESYSGVSNYWGDNNSVATTAPQLEEGKKERLLRWSAHTSSLRASRPRQVRRLSSRSNLPRTIGEDSAPTKRTSLLGTASWDTVISKVQVFKGGISDIFPVTDFQALAITGSLLESKWMLNYFYLEGNGPLDLNKLKQAAYRVVAALEILRTVFIPDGDRFLQVVLKKLHPEIIHQQTDSDLETFTTELRRRDHEHGPRLGEPFTQFVVVKQKQSGYYRIFIRLSHAQYDGVCIGKILEAFQAAYNGKPIPSAPKFGNFVRASARTIAGAHSHWREILSGSTMTQIVDRFGPNYQRSAGHTTTLERNLVIRKIRGVNTTTATVVKAAWAYTLARIACKSDILFGHVISGRNSDVDFVNVVGPCLNTVPVRVVYRSDWSVLDLLNYIQEQQIANMPYESLGFREITRHCTDWPAWTTFSSVLQHDQNLQPDNATLQLGATQFKLGAAGTQQDFADFSINSTSNDGDKVGISLTYVPNSTITIDYAQRVFEMFCASIVAFSENPHELLQAPSELSSAHSPAIESKHIHKKAMPKIAATLPTDTGLPVSELRSVVAVLRSAWQQILHDGHGTSPSIGMDSDFFQLGGDIMGLAQVVAILSEQGFVVRVEDMLDNSKFVDQIDLLVVERKKQLEAETQTEKSPWGNKGKSKKAETGKPYENTSTFRALVRKAKARVRRV